MQIQTGFQGSPMGNQMRTPQIRFAGNDDGIIKKFFNVFKAKGHSAADKFEEKNVGAMLLRDLNKVREGRETARQLKATIQAKAMVEQEKFNRAERALDRERRENQAALELLVDLESEDTTVAYKALQRLNKTPMQLEETIATYRRTIAGPLERIRAQEEAMEEARVTLEGYQGEAAAAEAEYQKHMGELKELEKRIQLAQRRVKETKARNELNDLRAAVVELSSQEVGSSDTARRLEQIDQAFHESRAKGMDAQTLEEIKLEADLRKDVRQVNAQTLLDEELARVRAARSAKTGTAAETAETTGKTASAGGGSSS